MSTPADVEKLLYAYVRKQEDPIVQVEDLLSFTHRYLEHYAEKHPELTDLDENTENLLYAHLVALDEQGRCEVTYQNERPKTIYYPEYFMGLVRNAYKKLDQRPDLPFPSEESLNISVPNELVYPINVRNEFMNWLGDLPERPVLVRLMFPEGVRSVIATSELLSKTLADIAVHKIRDYLRSERNSGYMRSKLSGAFPGRDVAVRDMMDKIQTNPDEMLKTIMKPTDFTFQVWTTLSTFILKEYGPKAEKLVEEHDFCRAAHLIGYYNVYYKGVQQREKEKEQAVRTLESKMRSEPYAYSISDVLSFTDSKGVPLTKKYDPQHVHQYLAERIKPDENTGVPEIFRFHAPNDQEYYIRSEFLVRKVIGEVHEASRELREDYIDEWYEALEQDRTLKPMVEDQAFAEDVAKRLKSKRPFLYAMLDYRTLYLAATAKTGARRPEELSHILDYESQQLRPYPEILELDRKEMLRDARLLLPFWQANPMLRAFVTFVRKLFVGLTEEEKRRKQQKRAERKSARDKKPKRGSSGTQEGAGTRGNVGSAQAQAQGADVPLASTKRLGGPGEPAAGTKAGAKAGSSGAARGGAARGNQGASSNKERAVAFRKAIHAMQRDYVGENASVEKTLDQLAEEWNPLLDPTAKANLIEDVNSLVRDFLRRMKVGFRYVPPDRQRIRSLAEQLAQNQAFDQIKRKDALKRYLELYMLKLLGK